MALAYAESARVPPARSRASTGHSCPLENSSPEAADLLQLFDVEGIRRDAVEDLVAQVFLGRGHLSVSFEDQFGGDPAAAQPLVLVELDLQEILP